MENAITNIADLKTWFFDCNAPFYTLYRGTEVKAGAMISKNDTTGDVSQAWILLEKSVQMLSKHGSTIFVLVRKKNDNTTTGNSTIFAYNPFGAAMYGGAVAGIGNMLPANTQPQGMSAVEVQKMIQSEREKWEQAREIEDLKSMISGIQEDQGKTERLVKTVLNHPIVASIGSILLAKVAGIDPKLLASMQGNTEGVHNSDDEHPVGDDDDDEYYNQAIENFESAGFAASDIKKFSEWAKQNKDFAKQMFSQNLTM